MGLTHWLRLYCRQRGQEVALVFGEKRFTWLEFEVRVSRFASVLRHHDVGTGDRIAMLAHSSHRYIEFFYASLWAGGIMVPLNTRLALPEIIEQAGDAEPVILIVDESFVSQAGEIAKAVPSIRHVVFAGDVPPPSGMVDYESAIRSATPCSDAGRHGSDVACLFYTGGTTGRPKGVMLSHSNLIFNAQNTITLCGLDETLVYLHAGPLFHLAAAGRVFVTTIAGGKHVVIPRFTPSGALEAMVRERVTMVTFVPTMLSMVLQLPDFGSYALLCLKLLSYGGSPMPEGLLHEALNRLPETDFAQSYGMTECSPMVTFLSPVEHRMAVDTRRLLSAGRAAPGVEIRVVDDQDSALPAGMVGEILVRGPNVMKGYWRQPELTATALRGGWMHTGDVGRFDADGYLYVVDRMKDMIISGGENIYSSEVESAISRYPGVSQCAVIGIPDPKWGETVHAIVVPHVGHLLEKEGIIAHCRSLIAGYKCPRSIEIREEPLPTSAVGKINKVALRAPFWVGRIRQVN